MNFSFTAFSNFPTEEVQFVFSESDNQLIFGNKKTRVALKTFSVNNIQERINKDLFVDENIEFKDWKK